MIRYNNRIEMTAREFWDMAKSEDITLNPIQTENKTRVGYLDGLPIYLIKELKEKDV